MVAFEVVLLLIRMEYNFLCFYSPENATSSNLASEDWALNMEICDMINSTEEGCVVSNTALYFFTTTFFTTDFFSEI